MTSLEEGVSGVRLAGVDVKGDILMQTDQDATDVTVGSVVWSARNATVNEVDAYLRKHGAARLCSQHVVAYDACFSPSPRFSFFTHPHAPTRVRRQSLWHAITHA